MEMDIQSKEILLGNIDKLHSTEMGLKRIKENLELDEKDIITLCKKMVQNPEAEIFRQGKNWYVSVGKKELTINASSYTIITAHKIP